MIRRHRFVGFSSQDDKLIVLTKARDKEYRMMRTRKDDLLFIRCPFIKRAHRDRDTAMDKIRTEHPLG